MINRPNYTQVWNELFDEWLSKLTGAEVKVVLCIFRKIIGFHKDNDTDNISISQIQQMTGLSNRAVIDALRQLKEYDLILYETDKTNTHKITLNIETYEKSSQGENVACEESSQVKSSTCEKSSQALVRKVHIQKKHTKENSIKENNNAKSTKLYFDFETKEWYGITTQDRERWLGINPNADVDFQLSKAGDWLLDFGRNKKKFRMFLFNWFVNSKKFSEKGNSETNKQGSKSSNIQHTGKGKYAGYEEVH